MELTLETFLVWVFSGGGAAVLIRWVVSKIPWFGELDESERALISGVATVVVVALAYAGAAFAGYAELPTTTLQWIEMLFVYIGMAIGLPSIMSTFMRVRFAVLTRRGKETYRNRLFWIRW